METVDALKAVNEFKGENLKGKFLEIKESLIGKGKDSLPDFSIIYNSALEVKKISSQIDEIVHGTGIIQCLGFLLERDEVIKDLSLASSANGEGIDLVTNKRIAEFKFARWNDSGNGTRSRNVFADLVSLYLNKSKFKKELYVFDSKKVTYFFNNSNADFRKKLSKHSKLRDRIDARFIEKNIICSSIKEVYAKSNVEIIDIETVLKLSC